MKSRSDWALGAVVLSILWISTGAAPASAGGGCSLRTLKGAYEYAGDGFKTAGDNAAQRTPFAQSGREVFNGDGTMSGMGTASMNGATVRLTYKGTYTLNADCAGAVTFTDNQGQASHYDIFVDAGGERLSWVQTDPSIVSAGWESRR